jgi:hypothetical protein
MLHQPSTCLQQPLLQADRRPILDSLGQLLEFLVPGGLPANRTELENGEVLSE